jgi:hypothetical protein
MSTENPSESNSYSAWAVGYAAFAAILMIIAGVLGLVQGLVALVDDEFYVFTEEYVFEFSVTTWGWIHLIGGIILIASGIGIFSGNVLARIVGVVVAALSVVWNVMFLPYYTIWALLAIGLSIGAIWALTAHGRDIVDRPSAGGTPTSPYRSS